MKLLSKQGQSIGEYAILFAIVLGAVVVMQNYVRNRIADKIKTEANLYNATGLDIVTESTSESESGATMTSARAGKLTTGGKSTSTMTSPK